MAKQPPRPDATSQWYYFSHKRFDLLKHAVWRCKYIVRLAHLCGLFHAKCLHLCL